MKYQLTTLLFLLNICLSNAAYAGWFDSEETRKKDRADLIVSECVQMIQQDYNENKNKDNKVTVEVFAGDIRILSENVVLTEIIILSATSKHISKQVKEGVCRFIPESNNIAWQPFAYSI